MEILKYPIGQFNPPDQMTGSDRKLWIKTLEELPKKLNAVVEDWSDEQLDTPYREDAWSVRQLIHHIADSHMNSLIRFKWALTEDTPVIKAYDQSKWAELSDVKLLHPSVSLDILKGIHLRLVTLLENMSPDDFNKEFYHPEMKLKLTLYKLLAMYAWHSEHHLAQIEQLKRQKKW